MTERVSDRYMELDTKPNRLDPFFTSPADQVANLRRWNTEKGWGFRENHFKRVTRQIIELSVESDLLRWVLVPYLDDFYQTVEDLIQIAGAQPRRLGRSEDLPPPLSERRIRLLEGVEYPGKCLMWVLADLGSDCRSKPGEVCKPETALHIRGLAVVAQHPKWGRAIYTEVDGRFVPSLFVPGIQVNWNKTDKPEDDDWSGMLRIQFDRDHGQLSLYIVPDNVGRIYWAVGKVVRELKS